MSFKAEGHDVSDNFSPFPSGVYKVALVKVERKDGSKPGAMYLNCQFKVVEGKHAKRMIFHIFNLQNNNAQTVEIAEKQLRQLMLAAGVPTLKDQWDLSDLMNKPAEARIAIQKDEEYGDKNKINAFIVPEGHETKSSAGKQDEPKGDPWDKKKKKKKKKGKKSKK